MAQICKSLRQKGKSYRKLLYISHDRMPNPVGNFVIALMKVLQPNTCAEKANETVVENDLENNFSKIALHSCGFDFEFCRHRARVKLKLRSSFPSSFPPRLVLPENDRLFGFRYFTPVIFQLLEAGREEDEEERH